MSSENDEKGTGSESAVAEEFKLTLDVSVEDSGPCRKHIRVKVPRSDIEHYQNETVDELCTNADVPGFRIGHVPRKLIEKKFRQEVGDQVKQKLLVESMEQLAEEHDFDPINEPNIDIESIDLPEEGDFEYEFDIEVRPEFDLPDYAGLKIERPIRETSDSDVEGYLEKFLSQYGQLVPHEGAAEPGDYISATIEFEHNGESLSKIPETTIQLKPILRLADAELDGFDKLMKGVTAGETRETKLTISSEAETIEMRGETVLARFNVLDAKRLRLPELTKEFLQRIGFDTEEDMRNEVRKVLERQVTYEQRQSARRQVLEKITESADWDLPEEMVLKQVENALRREILEMQQAGFTNQEIQARENELRQSAVTTTSQALKEHFVLDKIATKEEIDVEPSDIEAEIQLMAMQSGENPRRVRARLAKSGMIENLEAQIRERKAVDFILDKATFKDIEMEPPSENRVEAIPGSICGPAVEPAAVASEAQDDE